jgi:dihydroorotate dehydrogenase (NAD+) catalytic subunit
VRCIWQLHAALPNVPIIGVGGIKTGLDALELVLAGASAIQVGTTIFHDPRAPVRVLAELADALAARGFARFADSVGHAHRLVRSPHEGHPHPDLSGEGALQASRFGVKGPSTQQGEPT